MLSGATAHKMGIGNTGIQKWYMGNLHAKVVSGTPPYKSGLQGTPVQKWDLEHLYTKVVSGASANKSDIRGTSIQNLSPEHLHTSAIWGTHIQRVASEDALFEKSFLPTGSVKMFRNLSLICL